MPLYDYDERVKYPYSKVKGIIKQALKTLPSRLEQYFRKPRWDHRYVAMLGSHGYGVMVVVKHLSAVDRWMILVYQLTTDEQDRDANYVVKMLRFAEHVDRDPSTIPDRGTIDR